MLTLDLSLEKYDLRVQVNGKYSHTFSLDLLRLTEKQAAAFFDDPSDYGSRLYGALFPKNTLADPLADLPLNDRLTLRLEDEALFQIPWEYLYDGKRWLATEYALLRSLPVNGFQPPQTGERLPLLFVPSDPLMHGATPAPYYLTVESEWDALLDDLKELDPPVDLHQILPPTFDALQQKAASLRGGIVHFTGHGAAEKDTAFLLFEKPSGAADAVEAGRLASLLRGRAALVVLSACQSATPGESLEANLAALLCRQGTPFVLGMQLSVRDPVARRFSEVFYRFLFAGNDVYEATRQARLSILQDSTLEMGIPVLYAADPALPGNVLPPGKGRHVSALPHPALTGLPAAEGGFFGRQRALVDIGELLTPERSRQGQNYPPLSVVLHGPGGIGKTALLVKAAQRFAWRFPDGVLALPLEPLPVSFASALERLEGALGLPEDARLDEAARADRLTSAVHGRRLLLALDNFESLIHARDGDDVEKKRDASALFRLLRGLPA